MRRFTSFVFLPRGWRVAARATVCGEALVVASPTSINECAAHWKPAMVRTAASSLFQCFD